MGIFSSLFGVKKDASLVAPITTHRQWMEGYKNRSADEQMVIGVGVCLAMNCIADEFGDPQGEAIMHASERVAEMGRAMRSNYPGESAGVGWVTLLLMAKGLGNTNEVAEIERDLKKIVAAVPPWARNTGSRGGSV